MTDVGEWPTSDADLKIIGEKNCLLTVDNGNVKAAIGKQQTMRNWIGNCHNHCRNEYPVIGALLNNYIARKPVFVYVKDPFSVNWSGK